jgi:peptidyl-prolyl cis-trans isomerase A (cyclophilin A)
MKIQAILFLFFFLISCKDNTNTVVNQVEKQPKIEKKVEQRHPFELENFVITEENAPEYLLWLAERNKKNIVWIHTEFGSIKIELFQETPMHRANFINLVEKEYFNTTYFHRVVKGFIIQGGNSDEMNTQKHRKEIGKFLIPSEFSPKLKHHYGALAAARSWENNPEKKSSPYEFYIIQNKNGSYHLDGEHTVFGKVVKGFDVLEKIAQQPTDAAEFPLLNIEMTVNFKEHVQ